MTSPRDAFLEQVRLAVAKGNRPGQGGVEPRGRIGYQGAGADSLQRFCQEFVAVGGTPHLVAGPEEAVAKMVELVRQKAARQVLLGGGPVLDRLQLLEPLRRSGVAVTALRDLSGERSRGAFFAADVGISGVDFLIAESGTLAVTARAEEPRSLSLLPPVHIAVADRSQLVPDLFDLFERFETTRNDSGGPAMPSCLTLITGPSKTGDIELRLVTGVHGPGEVHVVLLPANSSPGTGQSG